MIKSLKHKVHPPVLLDEALDGGVMQLILCHSSLSLELNLENDSVNNFATMSSLSLK